MISNIRMGRAALIPVISLLRATVKTFAVTLSRRWRQVTLSRRWRHGNMHIPDGFLTVPVWASLDAVAIPAVAAISWGAQRNFQDNRVPLMGVMGAFIFAAQMINFPVGNGTSGHLVGGALLTFTVGPAAASIVLTAILAIQAF